MNPLVSSILFSELETCSTKYQIDVSSDWITCSTWPKQKEFLITYLGWPLHLLVYIIAAQLHTKYVICRTCEICGSIARNVVGVNDTELAEQWNEANDTVMPTAVATTAQPAENRNFWQGHRFLNFLLACMVFAFVISWLFHFNVPS